VAEKHIPAGAAVTQPPDYEAGWRLRPRSEAGYYYHLANTPPRRVFKSEGRAGLGGVSVSAHGPWRALYLDSVEQGLAYMDQGSRGVEGGGGGAHDPLVIGFEYVRAMATAAAAMLGPLKLGGIPDAPRPRPGCHVLCVG